MFVVTKFESAVPICDFTFDPSQRPQAEAQRSEYENYSDELILNQWASVIPKYLSLSPAGSNQFWVKGKDLGL